MSVFGRNLVVEVLIFLLILNLLLIGVVGSDHVHDSTPPSNIPYLKYQTAYHFQPPKNWMNDPNGPMYYNGYYHLFYQYNPDAPVWSQGIVWGHSVSTDLMNWTPLATAITRSVPSDINGCWSGSATILPDKSVVMLYTGIDQNQTQVQNIAVPKNLSDPMLREWKKTDNNPIMVPPDGVGPMDFRDPSTAWLGKDNYWRVVVGAKTNGEDGLVFLYKTKDFVTWERQENPLRYVKGVGILECPDYFPVSVTGSKGLDTSNDENGAAKYVFKVSLFNNMTDHYTIGNYDLVKDAYEPNEGSDERATGLRFDYGKFYASKSFFDAKKNRRILWAWSDELDSKANDLSKGWAGIQTFPRTIWLDESGKQLMQSPIEEIKSLRRKKVSKKKMNLKFGQTLDIKGIKTSQADVKVKFHVPNFENAEEFEDSWFEDPQKLCTQKGASVKGGIGPFGLLTLASQNLEEYTAIFFRIFKHQDKYITLMCSDQSRSSLRPEVSKVAYGGFVNVDLKKSKGRISLRTLIDHSVVESFGGEGRTCITSRVYPMFMLTEQPSHLYLFNNGTQEIKMKKLKAWEMAKANINQESNDGFDVPQVFFI